MRITIFVHFFSSGEEEFFSKRTKRSFFSSFVGKKKRSKRRNKKTSWLRGRMRYYMNHEMNSLRSDNISFYDSYNITSSKDLFVRNVFITPSPFLPRGGSIYANVMSIKQPSLAPKGQRLCERYQNLDGGIAAVN